MFVLSMHLSLLHICTHQSSNIMLKHIKHQTVTIQYNVLYIYLQCNMESETTSITRSGRSIRPKEPYTPEPTKSKNTKQKSKGKGKSTSKDNTKTSEASIEHDTIDELDDDREFDQLDPPPRLDDYADEPLSDGELSLNENDDLLVRLNALQRELDEVKQGHISKPATHANTARGRERSRDPRTGDNGGSRKRGSSSVSARHNNKTARLADVQGERRQKSKAYGHVYTDDSEGEINDDSSDMSNLSDLEDEDIPNALFGSSTSTVSRKLHAKAVAGKYIEFSQLLPQYQHVDQHKYVLASNRRGGPARMMRSQKNIPLNIEEWTEAFLIYLPMVLESKTSANSMLVLTQNMLTYLRNITNMHKLGYRWYAYDRHFRKRQEKYPHPWEVVDNNLEMMYRKAEVKQNHSSQYFRGQQQYNYAQQNSQGHSRQKQQQNKDGFNRTSIKTREGTVIKAGTCARYNSQNSICKLPCIYRHVCGKCEGKHPIYRHGETNSHKPT